jgi:hypothetical protein
MWLKITMTHTFEDNQWISWEPSQIMIIKSDDVLTFEDNDVDGSMITFRKPMKNLKGASVIMVVENIDEIWSMVNARQT